MTRRAVALLIALALAPAATAQVAEPDGYRMEPYRAPVPATLEGARVVDAEQAHELWKKGETAFLDVLPRPPKPANLPEGTIWHEKPHNSIPGAIWLPNTGYGDLAPETESYLRDGLDSVTGGDTAHAVLFFCLPECWMSWNAAKRAIAEGYRTVYWFPGGVDGWAQAGYPTEAITAAPGEPEAE